MKSSFWFVAKEMFHGKSVIRAMMNERLKKEYLRGRVLDLGSGSSDKYTVFIPREENVQIEYVDQKIGNTINF